MPTTQQPVSRALTAIQARSRLDAQTSENLIASQKTREFSASALSPDLPPLTNRQTHSSAQRWTVDFGPLTPLWPVPRPCHWPDRRSLPLWPVSRPCHLLDRRSPFPRC